MEGAVTKALHHPERDYQDLIAQSAMHYQNYTESLKQGRDLLLEYNSCRPDIANELRDQAISLDQSNKLQEYMETIYDCFGVENEIHSEGCYAIYPGAHMTLPLTQLPEDGLTVTYDRDIALGYEDVTYLSWDHPLVTGAMDLLQAGELGNTSVIAVPIEGVARGTLMLESIFILESASSQNLQSNRYLPATSIRIFIDEKGKRHDTVPSYRTIENPGEKLKRSMIRRIVSSREKLLRKMVQACDKLANRLAPALQQNAMEKSRTTLEREIHRLEALIKVNPNVREEELAFYRQQLIEVSKRLSSSRMRLDALRVIVAT